MKKRKATGGKKLMTPKAAEAKTEVLLTEEGDLEPRLVPNPSSRCYVGELGIWMTVREVTSLIWKRDGKKRTPKERAKQIRKLKKTLIAKKEK